MPFPRGPGSSIQHLGTFACSTGSEYIACLLGVCTLIRACFETTGLLHDKTLALRGPGTEDSEDSPRLGSMRCAYFLRTSCVIGLSLGLRIIL